MAVSRKRLVQKNAASETVAPADRLPAAQKPTAVSKTSGTTLVWQLLLLAACAIAVSVNSIYNGFVYDDAPQVLNNPWITDFSYLPDIFTKSATHQEAVSISNYYRPIMDLVYMVSYALFGGLKPWGFHLANIFLHLCATVLVFLFSSLLFSNARPTTSSAFLSVPLLSALIFAVHPVHSEVIAWVACVPELSFTIFCLLSLCCYLKSESGYGKYYLWSVIFFGLGAFSKETAITILPLYALIDYCNGRARSVKFLARYLPFACVLAVYFVLRLNALGTAVPLKNHADLSSFELVINVPPLFCQYLLKLVVPTELKAFYVLHPVHSLADFRFILSAAGVVALFLAGIRLFKVSKEAFTALMIVVLPLLPVLYLRGLGESAFAERYLYFPSIGFSLLAAAALATGLNRERWKAPVSALLLLVLILFAVQSINQNRVWHDELSLWSDAAGKSPDSDMVHNHLGLALAQTGALDAAIREYQAAIALYPGYATAHVNLGNALADKGSLDAAINEYQRALSIQPDSSTAHCDLGLALVQKGSVDAGIGEYQRALALDRNSVEAHYNLGLALLKKGNLDAAIEELRATLTINGDFGPAREKLQRAYQEKTARSNRPGQENLTSVPLQSP
jgi:protein O-mannosyl-transferase